MISVKARISSRNVSIRELDDFIGKDVIISIREDIKERDLDDFFDCISNVEIDENVIEQSRELSLIWATNQTSAGIIHPMTYKSSDEFLKLAATRKLRADEL